MKGSPGVLPSDQKVHPHKARYAIAVWVVGWQGKGILHKFRGTLCSYFIFRGSRIFKGSGTKQKVISKYIKPMVIYMIVVLQL